VSEHHILQIIPAVGWWYEDRSAAPRARGNTGLGYGYWYTHEPLIAWALVESTDGAGEKWTEVLGIIRSDEDEFVSPQACDPEAALACDVEERVTQMGCQHWQSLPTPVAAPKVTQPVARA
jgi:hypothetical protein